MPEGHTLRRLALDLTDSLGGQRLRVGSPQGRFADSAAALDGSRLLEADSCGKHLFLTFDVPGPERVIHIHLGLCGTLALTSYDDQPDPPVGQVRLRLIGDTTVADLRGATACDLWTEAEVDACLAKLGPDPLRSDADPDRAWQRIRRSERTLASLLMDQAVLAGVGNVYRAEVLFRHRLDPMRPGRSLRSGQWQAMWGDLCELMRDGVVVNRIDTVRPEHTPEAMGRLARVDDHGGEVYVYRRASMPCHVCGRTVKTSVVEGRNLFWCPGCQKPYRDRTRAGGRSQ